MTVFYISNDDLIIEPSAGGGEGVKEKFLSNQIL
jgi:hypothetical protein